MPVKFCSGLGVLTVVRVLSKNHVTCQAGQMFCERIVVRDPTGKIQDPLRKYLCMVMSFSELLAFKKLKSILHTFKTYNVF